MQTRKDEIERVWFRGNRCFSVDGKWFIATREKVDIGPFDSQKAALTALPNYLSRVSKTKKPDAYIKKVASDAKQVASDAKKIARDGVWSSSNYI